MPTRQRVQELVRQVEQGQIIAAIHEFYADQVSMQENRNPPTVGKAANLARERDFVESVAQIHEVRAVSAAIDGDLVAINWIFDYTDATGRRVRLEQIAHQVWQGDRIVRERFFYDPTSLAA